MPDFTMPSLGADMDRGTLAEWLVEPGDRVRDEQGDHPEVGVGAEALLVVHRLGGRGRVEVRPHRDHRPVVADH